MREEPQMSERDASEPDVVEEHTDVAGDVVLGDPVLDDTETRLSRDAEIPEADALEQSEPLVGDEDEDDDRPHAGPDEYV